MYSAESSLRKRSTKMWTLLLADGCSSPLILPSMSRVNAILVPPGLQDYEGEPRCALSSNILATTWDEHLSLCSLAAQSNFGQAAAAWRPASPSAPHRGMCPWPGPPEGILTFLYAFVYVCLTMISQHQC